MCPEIPEKGKHGVTEELDPKLREVVEGILRESVPDDLMCTILDRVRDSQPRSRPKRRRWVVAWAVGAAAACLAIAAFVWQRIGHNQTLQVEPPPIALVSPSEASGTSEDAQPTLGAYRQAACRSPEALDALLTQHAATLLPLRLDPGRSSFSLLCTEEAFR